MGNSVCKNHFDGNNRQDVGGMSKLISVVIPIYNSEQYLRECLNSLLPQCGDEVDVILVNDGSIDHSLAICEEYVQRFPNIVKLVNQKNSGSYLSRMNGVRLSTSEFIMFMDSDDMLLDNALDVVLAELHKEHFDLVLFNATSDFMSRKPFFSIPFSHEQLFLGEEKYPIYQLLCCSDSLNSLWTKCIRRELLLQTTIPDYGQRLTIGEDLYQILDITEKAHKIIYLDKVLYFYRIRENSISRVYSPYFFPSVKRVCVKRMEYAKKWSKKEELVDFARIETYKELREVARKIFVSDMSWKEAKKEMQKLRSDPFFNEYYMKAHDDPDRRDVVLKAPLPVFHLARILMGKVKAK